MDLNWTLGRVRDTIGGTLHGPEDLVVEKFARLELCGEKDIGFLREERYVPEAVKSKAAAFIVYEKRAELADRPQIVAPDVMLCLLQLLGTVANQNPEPPVPDGIHPTAVIDPEAKLGEGVAVGPHAVIEAGAVLGDRTRIAARVFVGRRVRLGRDCVIHPGAVIHHDVTIGDRVLIWSNAVIGRDGFGFVPTPDKTFIRLPHLGTVVLEDDVEIGPLATIDRAMIDETRVRRATKIDAHCHIAHNCSIGEKCMLAGFTKMAGSVVIGDRSLFAADASINEHQKIGSDVIVGAAARVHSNIPSNEQWLGYPARPAGRARRIMSAQNSLPELRRLVKRIARKVGIDMEKASSSDG